MPRGRGAGRKGAERGDRRGAARAPGAGNSGPELFQAPAIAW
jgi:hypothetical protein